MLPSYNLFLLQKLAENNISLGETVLKGYGLFTESYWFWIGICALFCYTVIFNILLTLFLTYLNRKLPSGFANAFQVYFTFQLLRITKLLLCCLNLMQLWGSNKLWFLNKNFGRGIKGEKGRDILLS